MVHDDCIPNGTGEEAKIRQQQRVAIYAYA